MVEGSGSRTFLNTKRMMYESPEVWRALMRKLVPVLAEYLKSQAAAGAGAVQIFDSWVGCLSPEDYRAYVLPYSRELIARVAEAGVPIIHFGTGTATLLELMREAGGDVIGHGTGHGIGHVIGIDWRIDLGEAWRRVGYDVAVQGNLDPIALVRPARTASRAGGADLALRPQAVPATFLTSATGFSRKRRLRTCERSWRWFTNSGRRIYRTIFAVGLQRFRRPFYSPEGAQDSSPRRKPWDRGGDRGKPGRGDRTLSFVVPTTRL